MHSGDADGDTAKTLVLVGLILDLVGEVILFGLGVLFLAVPILGTLVLGLAVIGFLWIALVYFYSYDRIAGGDYEGARTPTLVFAILSLVTLALVPGILFLIAYIKLGDALKGEAAYYAWGQPAPLVFPAPLSGGSRYCTYCGRPSPASSAFCAGCGARMTGAP